MARRTDDDSSPLGPCPHRVQLTWSRSGRPDADRLEGLLGTPALPVPRRCGPGILADGRFHTSGCRWLQLRVDRSEGTLRRNAADLAGYIRFLLCERGLHHADPARSDVFAATYDDLLAYRSHQLTECRVSPARWSQINSSIKQFHEFAQQHYGLRLPWTPRAIPVRLHGHVVQSNQLGARTKRGSSGVPLDPYYAELLVQGAMRVDVDGVDHGGPAVERDVALVCLGLATGARRHTATYLTAYELPSPTDRSINVARIPDLITKNLAGGDALAFEHRLQVVRDYVSGPRHDTARLGVGRRWADDPIRISAADAAGWRGSDDRREYALRWTATSADLRRRLVAPDGSSPLVFLRTDTGTPLSTRTASRIVADARDFVRRHIEGDFPAKFRLHDLRHTYAVHLAVLIYRQHLAPHISGAARDAYLTRAVNDAVGIVQASLGHATVESTRLYVTHAAAQILSGVPTDAYLGEL